MAFRNASVMEAGNITKFSEKECRLVVAGHTGSGKSAVVNTILGAKICTEGFGAGSVTEQAVLASRPRFGKEIHVVDTPGVFDSRPEMPEAKVRHELARAALLLAPGPHAILLTIAVGQRFSDEEKAVVHKLRVFFGEDSIRHTIVVFTKGDELVRNGVTIEEYLKSAPADLNSLINDVSYRYVVFNNKEPTIKGRDACAKSALDLVEKMARHNRTKHYSSDLFCHAEKQMVACDRETERPFRPKQQGGSSNSLDSLSTVPDDHLIVEISSILESEPSLVEETKVKEERTTAAKDHSALRELMGRLVRHVSRRKVANGNNNSIVESLMSSPFMLGLVPLLQANGDVKNNNN
ncbi:hypothetical protein BaRGS_00027638 [Batillaria attramentaria]|uniref:AIG1-type G domain-containing protein n=1 Tax=Batillaria attramentaria TaxID=370345 RepID=A0ABD0K1Q0_9CAEN